MGQGLQAEKAVLGAILLNPDAIYECSCLKPDYFSIGSHRLIFFAMYELSLKSSPIDLITLCDKLGPDIEKVGGHAYLASLLDGVPDRPSIEQYVRIVEQSAKRRRLETLATSIAQQCADDSETTADCISVAADRILALASDAATTKTQWLSDYSADFYARIFRAAGTPLSDLPIGLPTGIKSIDRMTTGLRPGELWILASWTGEGKSILAVQIIVENVRRQVPVLLFTPEMNKRQVLARTLPQLTNGVVKGRHLRDPRHMTAVQIAELERTQPIIDSWPLAIHDGASTDIATLYAHSMAMVRKHKIRLIVVDYLQLIRGRGQSRYDKVSDVSNTLRELAKNAQVPVLAVSQMARTENREKRTPRIFDLKESGSLEQDAHVIMMPYRPQDKDGRYTGEDLIIIGKQREGPCGVVKIRFDSLTLTFQPRGDEDDVSDFF